MIESVQIFPICMNFIAVFFLDLYAKRIAFMYITYYYETFSFTYEILKEKIWPKVPIAWVSINKRRDL